LVEGDPSAGDLGEDLLSGGGPHEWFRVSVVGFQVVLDGGDEVVYAVEHPPADGLVGQVPKLPFHLIIARRSINSVTATIPDTGINDRSGAPIPTIRRTRRISRTLRT
jgi:hypothetical protein